MTSTQPILSKHKANSLYVKKLEPDAFLPVKGSTGAAGYDLCSYDNVTIKPHDKAMIHTKLAMVVPEGTYGRIAPRSGLAWKHAIDVLAGVVDYDYRGEVCVILINHGNEDFKVGKGDRIAQLILEKIEDKTMVQEVKELPTTQRGQGGFGSTGLNNSLVGNKSVMGFPSLSEKK